ncbi:major capsid protein E [Bradyrhizobium japonicum]|uniref:Major capsid protein E n=1 Tax=Bradyrhizobium japonicum TaxID=375 RepID=A0A1Y2JPR8_BRAJP|nr:major capsid protein [Bradyrhizobium japonicum]OSJ31559.1 major capsid protein E [Bradyrhizobium japonicum]
MLDVFRGDAFGVVPLTIAINNLKFIPGYISSKGLFTETSVATTAIAIEEKNNVLSLVAPTPRGAPGVTIAKPRRAMRMLGVPHFEINDAIMAEEVQGVRPFGEETGAESVMTKVAERMQTAGQSLEYTKEHARVGAIKGIITYADGQQLNLFTEYSLTPPVAINFVFSANPATGAVRQQCAALIRTIAANLDGQSFSGVEAICGDAFFDALIMSPEVRATYLQTQDAAELRNQYISAAGLSWGSFVFGGILWTNYRGYASVAGAASAPMVETNQAYFYPTGVPNLFPTVFAPADYIETVNTMGKERYVKQYAMPNDKGVHLDTQMNALNFCSRPLALQKGTFS